MNYLKHYGVIGMKWGIRRYQPYGKGGYNPDKKGRYIGTSDDMSTWEKLNEPSIKRGKDKSNVSPLYTITKESENTTRKTRDIINRHKKPPVKRSKQMTDEELRRQINRLKLEREYDSLTDSEIKTWREKTVEVLDSIGDVASIAASMAMIYSIINKVKG